jgi:hypothetical protein
MLYLQLRSALLAEGRWKGVAGAEVIDRLIMSYSVSTF